MKSINYIPSSAAEFRRKKIKQKNYMKIKYLKPTTTVVLIKGGQHLLTGSGGVQATMSGYDEDTEGGFKQ